MIDELLHMIAEFQEARPDLHCFFQPMRIKALRLKRQEQDLRIQMQDLAQDYENLLKRAESMQELLRKQEACA